MRVAIDTNGLFTGQAGGARYIRGLLRGLKASKTDIDWFPLAWEVENLGYQQPWRACKTLYRELFWANVTAPRLLLRSAANVYHATGSYFVSVPQSVRRVVTLYDLAILRNPQRFRAWQRRAERKRLQRLITVDRVICISRFTADEAIQLLGLRSSRIEVVYCGCDFQSREGPVPEQRPDFPVPDQFFLFVGSLEPGKNLGLLKEAYQVAADQGKPLPPLLIVGVRWAGVATEGKPPPDWHYLGRQPDAVLVYLYRRALALAFPSNYEGFGLPVVEAMALGCPVLCSPMASLPEVGAEAVLWANLDPSEYLDSLRRLAANDDLRAHLSRAGQKQAAQFTWERCASGVLRVYETVVDHGG